MLKNLLNIDGGVISVVGSGGKKTFIENLSKELKEELAIGESVLITSTMGMEIPRGLRWDEIFIPDKIFLKTATPGRLSTMETESKEEGCSESIRLKGLIILNMYL